MLVANPPFTTPILHVVFSFTLPSFNLFIAFAKTINEFTPFSGSNPACDDFPTIIYFPFAAYGALL